MALRTLWAHRSEPLERCAHGASLTQHRRCRGTWRGSRAEDGGHSLPAGKQLQAHPPAWLGLPVLLAKV